MILLKTISREYYRQNIGFYLFLLLFAFGFLRVTEHKQFARLFMGNLSLMLLAGVFWALHVLKSFLFFQRVLELPTYSFLQDLTLLPKWKLFKELISLQLVLNSPFMAYGAFMLVIGIKESLWFGVALLVFLVLLLLVLPVWAKYLRLLKFNHKIEWKLLSFTFNPWPNWPWLYFLRYLLKKQPVLFFSTKIYAVFFIFGGAYLYPTDEYDARLLGLSVFFAAIGQFMIGRAYIAFSEESLGFERNMSKTLLSRFIALIPLAFSLVLIEAIVIIYHWSSLVNSIELVSSLIFIISLNLFLLIIGIVPYAQKEENQSKFFYASVLLFILIMFKIPLLTFALLFLGGSWLIFRSNYFTFETIGN